MALESHLCLPSGALLDHGAGHGTADGEALEKPSNEIAQTQGKEFLKKVNTTYQHMMATQDIFIAHSLHHLRTWLLSTL